MTSNQQKVEFLIIWDSTFFSLFILSLASNLPPMSEEIKNDHSRLQLKGCNPAHPLTIPLSGFLPLPSIFISNILCKNSIKKNFAFLSK